MIPLEMEFISISPAALGSRVFFVPRRPFCRFLDLLLLSVVQIVCFTCEAWVGVTLCNESVCSVGNGLCAVPRLRAKAERQGRRSLQNHTLSSKLCEADLQTLTPTRQRRQTGLASADTSFLE